MPDTQADCPTPMMPARALMVREPYLSFILMSKKRWELRGTPTAIRGPIGLIRSGSGHVVGQCEILDCIGPLDFMSLKTSPDLSSEERQELLREGRVPYLQKDGEASKTYAWIVAHPRIYPEPIRYRHPSGAITFVDLTKPGVLECTGASRSMPDRQLQLF